MVVNHVKNKSLTTADVCKANFGKVQDATISMGEVVNLMRNKYNYSVIGYEGSLPNYITESIKGQRRPPYCLGKWYNNNSYHTVVISGIDIQLSSIMIQDPSDTGGTHTVQCTVGSNYNYYSSRVGNTLQLTTIYY